MISHQHKCIFIHIPKTAGTSINSFFFPEVVFNYAIPDYERLYGWCPKRKLHLQHATSKQLLDTGLVTKEEWKFYYKFTIVRNPWDRAFSDYFWMMKDRKIQGSFKDYICRKGVFEHVLSKTIDKNYRGDHLLPQTDFFTQNGSYDMDYVGHFENLKDDLKIILTKLGINKEFNIHEQKTHKVCKHYSLFFNKTRKMLVEKYFQKDIDLLPYNFEDRKTGLQTLKNWI